MGKISLSAAAITFAASACLTGAFAQAPKPQAHDTNVDGVTAEVTEAVRRDGVLSVKVRFRNTGAKAATVQLVSGGNTGGHYVVAGSTKLLVLKDSRNTPLMPPLNPVGDLYPSVAPGGNYLYWAKFPAPPPDAKKVALYLPVMPPIEDIVVTEAK